MVRDISQALSRHGIVILLALAIVGVLARSWFAYQTTTAVVRQTEAAYDARRQVLTVLTDLLDQETGMRGYVSTKQRSYLAPFTAASARIQSDFDLAFKASETANAQSIEPTLLDAESRYKQWVADVATPLVAGSDLHNASTLQLHGK